MAARMVLVMLLASLAGCDGCGRKNEGPPVPASSDPEGNDLVVGAIVAAVDTRSGGVQLYKLIDAQEFPAPLGTELVMNAYDPKGADFAEAARLWGRRGELRIALPRVRVYKHMFMQRDHRVLAVEPVTDADRNAPIPQPEPSGR